MISRAVVAATILCFPLQAKLLQDTRAVSGQIDFSSTRLLAEHTYSLDGTWHFYWREFIPVAGEIRAQPIELRVRGNWKNAAHPAGPLPATGWGSYRLVMRLGENRGDLALRVPSVGTAYRLYANGLLIAQAGTPHESESIARSKTLPLVAPLPLPDKAGNITLVMHVSNYDDRHGGIWQTIRLGNRRELENSLRDGYALSTFLFGAIFIIGLYHFLLFMRRPVDKTNLAFALLCVLFAVRPLAEAGRYLLVLFPGMPWVVNSRLAYLTFYGALPLSAWFLRLVFTRQFHQLVFFLILAVMLPVCAAVLVLPPRLYTETLTGVQIFSLALILYGCVLILRAIHAGIRGSKTLGLGLLILFVTATLDILTVANILNLPELAPFGLIGFILSQSVVISLRQEDAYRKLEILAGENKELIGSMELKILERTATIAELSAEGDAVLNSLSEGVFLINRDKNIGGKFSKKVFEILELEAEDIMQRPFTALVESITTANIAEDARLYLGALFNNNIDDETAVGLNPLEKLTIRGRTSGSEKIIHFNFSRERRGPDIMAIFVSVRDITADELLRTEVEARERKARRQLEIVRTLFSVNPEALQAFYGSIETELEEIAHALGPDGGDDVRKRIEAIYRAAHTVKGSAQLFKVNFIAEETHVFEEKMQMLLQRGQIENLDMLSVNIAYAELEKSLEEFEEMILKILKFQKEATGMHMNAIDLLRDSLPKMVSETCQKLGKKARISFDNFSPEVIPRRYAAALRDSLVQCVRNALSHSIELPEARLSAGKNETGEIVVRASEQNDSIRISVRDDGASFNVAAIRNMALKKGLKSATEIAALGDNEIINFIFKPGFSTAEPGGVYSGRGAGMDVVMKKTREFGGKIRISWARGQFTEFTFAFPKK